MHFFATCKLGLESTVASQLRALELEPESVNDARIDFQSDYAGMARALVWLRTAERLLMEVGSFEAHSFDELFEGTKALPWKRYLGPNTRIHVTGKSAKSALFSVSDCQSIVKKAIVENLKAAWQVNSLPETGEELIVEVGLLRDQATLALDCCGAGLSRRGYRTYNVAAPLSETLGAGLLLLSQYRGDRPLIDPMCGSGTLPIEAALIAQHRAPSLQREFACEAWRFLPKDALRLAREEAQDSVLDRPVDILGSDIDAHSIELCKRHAKKAGVMVNWRVADVRELTSDKAGGLLIVNPPYGERISSTKAATEMARTLRGVYEGLSGWQLSVISSLTEFERAYGKRADKRRKLSNGGLPCTLYQYFAAREDRA